MDHENNVQKNAKPTLEDLSKEEILTKYKDLLILAKKAKKAKDELAKENIQLKESLSNSKSENEEYKKNMLNMQEVVAQFTEQKLNLTMEIAELQRQQKLHKEEIEQGNVENENLSRKLEILMNEKEVLMSKLQQVNNVGKTQREHLDLLEKELQKFKETQQIDVDLQISFRELKEKYDCLYEVSSQQVEKLHLFKDRFKEVQEKLKKLQICKKVLLETQNEYAEAVSSWQTKIIKVSQQLCNEIRRLTKHNEELKEQLQREVKIDGNSKDRICAKIEEISALIEDQINIPMEENQQIEKFHTDNIKSTVDERDILLQNQKLEINNLKQQLKKEDEILTTLQTENQQLKAMYESMEEEAKNKTQMLQQICETLAELREYQTYLQRKTQEQQENSEDDNLFVCEKENLQKDNVPAVFSEMKQLNQGLKYLGDFILQQQESLLKLRQNHAMAEKANESLQKFKKEQEEQSVRIKQLEQEVKRLKANNEKLKTREKQTNMLNLEIEAAEKTLKELRDNLIAKIKEMEQAKLELDDLKQQIDLLKKDKLAEQEKAEKLKLQFDTLQVKYETTKESEKELLLLKEDMEKRLQQQKAILESKAKEQQEELKKQMDAYVKLQQQNKEIENTLKQTSINCSAAQQRNMTLQKQLEQLKADYEAYKLKAQTVFSKQQNNNDKVKLLEVESQLENLEQNQKIVESQLQAKVLECLELQETLQAFLKERTELQADLDKLKCELKSLKQQNETMHQQHKQQMQKQQDALQQQRLHIQQLKESHQDELQQLLQKCQSQNHTQTLSEAEQAKIDINLMEREAAEGSEATDLKINLPKSTHDFMPLDELLSASINDINEITVKDENDGELPMSASILTVLEKKEQQIKHLSSLLAENEQDLAKITQMNDMLKEELRRQERSVERQEHMQNSEYLKNIVFKFLTLGNIDERIRLVPVMSTILKLSRHEVEMLDNVAKGQKTLNSTSSGWSFLPWSSGNN